MAVDDTRRQRGTSSFVVLRGVLGRAIVAVEDVLPGNDATAGVGRYAHVGGEPEGQAVGHQELRLRVRRTAQINERCELFFVDGDIARVAAGGAEGDGA